MIRLFFIINVIFYLINIYGCSPAGVIASGGASTMVIAEGDRTVGTIIDDTTVKVQIAQKFISSDNNLFLNVEAAVLEGRVLLTGIVDKQESRIEAVRRVWEVAGVKEVINEIEVGNKTSLKEYSQDLWITTQIKGVAAKKLGLRSISYNFETIKGKVYVTGITSKKNQLNLLIESINNIKGVKEIVNYVILKE